MSLIHTNHSKKNINNKNAASKFDYIFKILFLGGVGVGKTSIINRYVKNIIQNDQKPTIGIDYRTKIVKYNNKNIQLKIFDTSGQERFRSLTKNYYQRTDGIIMVFDVKNYETFEELTYWMEEIKKNCNKSKIGLILVGNKNDGNLDEKKINKEQANSIAKEYDFKYIETSALIDYNIKECFELMVHTLFEKNIDKLNEINNKENNTNNGIILNDAINMNRNNHNNENNYNCCYG